jgi:SWI/SNF-related matrix-associated actin-dependent regulator of chromatin subfamily A containing DEAD/H box 1
MRESAKFKLLAELLPELRSGGHRVLLFSQWTSILDLVEWLMQVLISA